jgi:ferredoxin
VKVIASQTSCIGAGQCVLSAPNVFAQQDDGRVILLAENPGASDQDGAREAASLCPSGSIDIKDDNA